MERRSFLWFSPVVLISGYSHLDKNRFDPSYLRDIFAAYIDFIPPPSPITLSVSFKKAYLTINLARGSRGIKRAFVGLSLIAAAPLLRERITKWTTWKGCTPGQDIFRSWNWYFSGYYFKPEGTRRRSVIFDFTNYICGFQRTLRYESQSIKCFVTGGRWGNEKS